MNYLRIGRYVAIAVLFVLGTLALWQLTYSGPFDLPGEIRAVLSIGPFLLLVTTYALIRGFKSARYLTYACVIYKVIEAALAISISPRAWLPISRATAFIVSLVVFVHRSARTASASQAPARRPAREAGLFFAYLIAVVLCLGILDLIRGPTPVQNLRGVIQFND